MTSRRLTAKTELKRSTMESMARANGACFSVGMIGEFVPLANAFQGTLVDVDGEDGEGDVLMQIARSVVWGKRCLVPPSGNDRWRSTLGEHPLGDLG